jgi:hypothetical protein
MGQQREHGALIGVASAASRKRLSAYALRWLSRRERDETVSNFGVDSLETGVVHNKTYRSPESFGSRVLR